MSNKSSTLIESLSRTRAKPDLHSVINYILRFQSESNKTHNSIDIHYLKQ
jgi:hypothetical protein